MVYTVPCDTTVQPDCLPLGEWAFVGLSDLQAGYNCFNSIAHYDRPDLMLKRIQVTYEFCVDAPGGTDEEALEIFRRQHALAIQDDRCGVVDGPVVTPVMSSLEFQENTLDEVPLGSLDYTLRERLARGE